MGEGRFVSATDYPLGEFHALKADTLRELGKTSSKEVSKGNVGAYSVADPKIDNYYVVIWDAEPEYAEEDTAIELEGQKYPVSK